MTTTTCPTCTRFHQTEREYADARWPVIARYRIISEADPLDPAVAAWHRAAESSFDATRAYYNAAHYNAHNWPQQ